MSVLPVPDLMRADIYELRPRMFTERGIRLILLDVDNTLAPYTVHEASEALRAWVLEMQSGGLELYILSNNKGDRPGGFAAALGLPYRKRSRKPSVRTAREIMAERRCGPAQTALIGDQVYTDVLCAKRCGVYAVLVRPIEFNHFWLRLRYWAEAPFRLGYRIHSKFQNNII